MELAPHAYAASVGLVQVFCIKTEGQQQEENPGARVDDAALFQGMRHRGLPEVEQLTGTATVDEYWDGDKVQIYKGLQRKKWNEVLC